MARTLASMIKLCTIELSVLVVTSPVYASGYHLGLQSVTAVSTGNAAAAEAADPTTIVLNPAGLAYLEGAQINSNLFLIKPDINYNHAHGTFTDGSAVQGRESGNISNTVQAVPQGYFSYRLNDKWVAGLGLYIPYAAKTNDGSHSVMRYNVNKTNVKAIDINPAIALKLSKHHSLGIGLIAQYLHAEIQKYADFTPVGSSIAGVPSSVLHQAIPGEFDARGTVKGNDWGYGFNAGWLWDINNDVRVGLSYRSKINHHLRGTARWQPKGNYTQKYISLLDQFGYKPIEAAEVQITTPEVVSIHGMWTVNPKWNVFGNVSWTRSSRLHDLDINFENEKSIDQHRGFTANTTHIYTNWRDTLAVGMGASYQQTTQLQWRFGVNYDQSPVRSSSTRLSTIPDGNRWLFGAGMKYNVDKHHSLALSYTYLHIQRTHMRQQDQGLHVSSNVLGEANYRSYAHIFGASYNYKF
ncbi:MAG: transporter [Apibacter sp.]|nr:transporter [Apibacter sp.]